MNTDLPNCSPDLEQIAAYLDESLDPAERDALEAHLAQCATCTELLAETHSLMEMGTVADGPAPELDSVRQEGGQAQTDAENRTATVRPLRPKASEVEPHAPSAGIPSDLEPNKPWTRWLIAAAVLVAVSATAWFVLSTNQSESATLVARLPDGPALRNALPGDWTDDRWSAMRGAEVLVPNETAFRLGVRTVDLAASLRAEDFDRALALAQLLDTMFTSTEQVAIESMVTNLALIQGLERSPRASRDELEELASDFDNSLAVIEPQHYVKAGRWASAADLAALTETRSFFSSKQWREGLDLLSNAPEGSELAEIGAALRALTTDTTPDLAKVTASIERVTWLLGSGRAEL